MPPKTDGSSAADFSWRRFIVGQVMERCNGWMIAWTVIFAANLPFPLFVGMTVTLRGGLVGMGVAVVTMWIMGLHACRRGGSFREALCYGGVITAFLQPFYCMHMIAGAVGFVVWGLIVGLLDGQPPGDDSPIEIISPSQDPLVQELGGCVVTFTTGGVLALVGVAFGYFVLWTHARDERRKRALVLPSGNIAFDAEEDRPYMGA